MRHRLFPLAVSLLAGIGPALAETPVMDVAREATEKSIADCMTKARVYKDGALQPSKGITGSMQTTGQGQLPSVGSALLSANNVTAPSTGVVSNMDLSAVQTTVAGGGMSVTGLNLNTVAQTVAALGAVASGIQGNKNNTQAASAIIGALSALRASGRFMVTISTCPWRSISACGCPAPEAPAPEAPVPEASPASCAAVAVTAIPLTSGTGKACPEQ